MQSIRLDKPQLFLQNSVNELNMNRDLVQQAQILLRGHKSGELNVFGNMESSMLLGLKILLQMYLVLHLDKLTNDQISKIEKMIIVMDGLEKSSYAKWADWANPEEFKAMQSQHESELKKILDTKGEVYIPGGFKGHHAIYKITKSIDPVTSKETYYRTEFNAGIYADVKVEKPQKLVWGVNKKEIKEGFVAETIHADCVNFFSSSYKPIGHLGDTIKAESYEVAEQSVGNCTVRNSCEMLRDGLADTSLFRDFFQFSSKSKVDDLIEKIDFTSQRDSKKTVRNKKIGDYSRFIQSILNEAKIILKESPIVMNEDARKQFESMMIKQ